MIVRWFNDLEPAFGDFARLRDELERMFDIGLPLANIRSVPKGTFPAINMQEDKDGVHIQAYMPGVDPKKVEVTFEDNALSIKGERTTVPERNKTSYHRRERFDGVFSRIISLPHGLAPDKIKAHYSDGVLTVSIAKQEEQKPKQITIR